MNNIEFFFQHLCEYYNVTIEDAIDLSTRKTGRKPSLPGSKTCDPVSGMNLEEIWDSQERDSEESIFKFYKDQGAWSAFRQCMRLSQAVGAYQNYLLNVIERLDTQFKIGRTVSICEYGCGTAPFGFLLLNLLKPDIKINFYISDVDCEHLNFGEWRLNQIKKHRKLENVKIIKKLVEPNSLPTYEDKLDAVFIFEVLEHVPSPIATTLNLINQINSGGFLIENFIKHEDEKGRCDLPSSQKERSECLEYLDKNLNLFMGETESKSPNGTRIWMK
jgi:hypothetical protein